MPKTVDLFDDIPITPPALRKKLAQYSKKAKPLHIKTRVKDVRTHLENRLNETTAGNGSVHATDATTTQSTTSTTSAAKRKEPPALQGGATKRTRTDRKEQQIAESDLANATPTTNTRPTNHIIPKGARSKTTIYNLLTPQQQHASDLVAPLHYMSTIQDIQKFLSIVSCKSSVRNLILHPKPIGFSSRKERKIECRTESQQLDMYSIWMRQPKNGVDGRVGLFITWTGSPVGMTKEDFKNVDWHAWVAVFIHRRLLIFDSKSDLLPKKKVTGKNLPLHRQRVLFTHLKNTGYCIGDVWVGGEGNSDQNICLPLTGSFVQKLMTGGFDVNKPEEEGFRKVKEMWRS